MASDAPIHVHWDADDFARVLDAVKAEGDAAGYRRGRAEMAATYAALDAAARAMVDADIDTEAETVALEALIAAVDVLPYSAQPAAAKINSDQPALGGTDA